MVAGGAQGEEAAAAVLGLRERGARVGGGPVRPTKIDSQPDLFQSRVWVYNLQLSHTMKIK